MEPRSSIQTASAARAISGAVSDQEERGEEQIDGPLHRVPSALSQTAGTPWRSVR